MVNLPVLKQKVMVEERGPVQLLSSLRASTSRSRYSFRIVELKEVVLQIRPQVVEFVPC